MDEHGRTEQRERLRLLSAEAELKELELARERGEFMTLVDVEKFDLVVMTKARILAVPTRDTPQLVGEDRVVIYDEDGNAIGTATSDSQFRW